LDSEYTHSPPTVSDVDRLYRQIGFLFDTDDGSLPELRLTGLTAGQTPLVYARLRKLATRINESAYFWNREAGRETPVDSVPNAAALVISGEADAFHFVLQDPRVGDVALPELGVFVLPGEVALDYRMGSEWGATKVAALVGLLCELQRLAPGSQLELEDYALAETRAQFAATVAQYCESRDAVERVAATDKREI
jgi:hypothetical protein